MTRQESLLTPPHRRTGVDASDDRPRVHSSPVNNVVLYDAPPDPAKAAILSLFARYGVRPESASEDWRAGGAEWRQLALALATHHREPGFRVAPSGRPTTADRDEEICRRIHELTTRGHSQKEAAARVRDELKREQPGAYLPSVATLAQSYSRQQGRARAGRERIFKLPDYLKRYIAWRAQLRPLEKAAADLSAELL